MHCGILTTVDMLMVPFILYTVLEIIGGELCIVAVGNSNHADDLISILHPLLAITGGEFVLLHVNDKDHADDLILLFILLW